jgi:formylglycine-generating enzyme required for sulfatase activity
VLVALRRNGEAARPPFAQVTRLNGRAIHDEFDVEAVRVTSAPGDEFRAEVIVEPAPDPFATPRTIVVRRTASGFDPSLASARGALRATLPPEGVELVVVSGAERRPVRLAGGAPSGLTLRATAVPLPCVAGNRLGALPLATHALPPGSYLVVTRREGFETLRLPFELRAGRATVLRVDLQAEGSSPPGFVEIPAGPWIAGADPSGRVLGWPREERWLDRFWIGRTEVTVADYLAFVNDHDDPRTVEEIREGERTRTFARIPRDVVIDRTARATCRPLWERRDADYVTDWDPELPVRFVSCEDADAYCRWLTCYSPLGQAGWWFRLPTEEEWEKTARGADGRAYPWGDRFDERMRRSDRAHDLTGLDSVEYERIVYEPVTRATRDESPYGVLDMAGNVLEWCIGESYEEIPFRRPWRGGCARGPEAAAIPSSQRGGGYPDRVSQNDGFRVVAWRPDAR